MIGKSIGNYVVRARVAEGGTGVVYLAEHPGIRRKVAVKVLHPELNRNPGLVERFRLEAKAACEIGNDHIVDVIDFGELPGGAPYLIMEWLDGRPLSALLRAETRLEAARAARIVLGVCDALGAAHARGIVHRDLKPDNVFLIPRGDDPDFVKVLDFGIAKLVERDGEAALKTASGSIVGTPAYMSPEQCRGANHAVDARSDIYSLGAMFYEMLAGAPPFRVRGVGPLLVAHLTTQPEPPRALHPDIPPDLEAIVLRALEKDPARRFQSIAEMAGAIRPFVPQAIPFHDEVTPDTLQRAATVIRAGAPNRRKRSAGRLVPIGAIALGLALIGLNHGGARFTGGGPVASLPDDMDAPDAAMARPPAVRDAGTAEDAGAEEPAVVAPVETTRRRTSGAKSGPPGKARPINRSPYEN